MIGVKGARGAGKPPLLLQYAHTELPMDHQVLYTSLDDLWFTENKLVDLADTFVKQGGRYLLLDEVHRYSGWSQELKNIYDDQPDLSVIFTGSSIMHLDKARADLSRRAVMYELRGLSFREYLSLETTVSLEKLDWEILLNDHVQIARSIIQKVKPLEHFTGYLKHGYYPYFLENVNVYPQKLEETISLALSTDLPALHDLTPASIEKIRQLLYIIAKSAPFKPNISKLSERTGVSRNTLISFLHHLEDLRIINGRIILSQALVPCRSQRRSTSIILTCNMHWPILPWRSALSGKVFSLTRHQRYKTLLIPAKEILLWKVICLK